MDMFDTRTFYRIGIAGFVLVIVVYGVFQARDVIRGPVIDVGTPRSGSTISDAHVEIAGEAHNISEITLNGRSILVDEHGRFEEQLLLPPGYTIMTLNARDRFGRTTTETLELVRK